MFLSYSGIYPGVSSVYIPYCTQPSKAFFVVSRRRQVLPCCSLPLCSDDPLRGAGKTFPRRVERPSCSPRTGRASTMTWVCCPRRPLQAKKKKKSNKNIRYRYCVSCYYSSGINSTLWLYTRYLVYDNDSTCTRHVKSHIRVIGSTPHPA